MIYLVLSTIFLAGGTIAQFNPTNWQRITGELLQASYDGSQICGCKSDKTIWCGDFTPGLTSPDSLSWRQIPGGLSQVSVSGDLIFGSIGGIIYVGNSRGDAGWTKVNGELNQVTYDGRILCGLSGGVMWCADSDLKTTPNWVQMPTSVKFKDVSVGDGQIFGLSDVGYIYYKANTDSTVDWTQVQGGLNQISFDGDTLCGTTSNGDIYCTSDILNPAPAFIQINKGSGISQVVVHGSQLVGTISGQIYTASLGTSRPRAPFNPSNWQRMNGELAQASYDGSQICGCKSDKTIWCADFTEGITSPDSVVWRQLSGGLSQVDVYGNLIFGSIGGIIYVGNARGDAGWTKVNGELNQITYDGQILCGLSGGGMWCANTNLKTTPNWAKMKATVQFKDVAVGDGQIFGLSDVGSIYYKASPDSTVPWTQIQGGLNQISFDGDTLCGTTSNGDIYCKSDYLNRATGFVQINKGSAINQIVVHGSQLVGTISNQIYTANLDTTQFYLYSSAHPCVNHAECLSGFCVSADVGWVWGTPILVGVCDKGMRNDPCRTGSDCTTNSCKNNKCSCMGFSSTSITCSDDNYCCGSKCNTAKKTCGCTKQNRPCQVDADCCSKRCDTANGICSCKMYGEPCTQTKVYTDECCSGTCLTGVCPQLDVGRICTGGNGTQCTTSLCRGAICSCSGSTACSNTAYCKTCFGAEYVCSNGACCKKKGTDINCYDATYHESDGIFDNPECCSGECNVIMKVCKDSGSCPHTESVDTHKCT